MRYSVDNISSNQNEICTFIPCTGGCISFAAIFADSRGRWPRWGIPMWSLLLVLRWNWEAACQRTQRTRCLDVFAWGSTNNFAILLLKAPILKSQLGLARLYIFIFYSNAPILTGFCLTLDLEKHAMNLSTRMLTWLLMSSLQTRSRTWCAKN